MSSTAAQQPSKVTKSKSALSVVESQRISKSERLEPRDNAPTTMKEMETKLMILQSELEFKDSMLKTASSAGQQLVTENDDLFAKVEGLTKREKDREDDMHTLKKTNEILKATTTRSEAEADELHSKLIRIQKRVKQLEEDNQLLKSLNDRKPDRHPSDPYKKQNTEEVNQVISKLEHENKTLEEFLVKEQEKCAQFFENEENHIRTMTQLKNENTDLQKDIVELNQENEALSHNLDAMQSDLSSFAETFQNLQTENESLQQQLDQRYRSMDEQDMESRGRQTINLTDSPAFDGRKSGRSLAEMIPVTSLADQGYADYDDLEEEAIDAPSSGTLTGSNQFRASTIDAQEEFYRLTVIAAKIKYNDVPISTAGLLEKVKNNSVAFHEVGDWLSEYLTNERANILKMQQQNAKRRPRVVSVTSQRTGDTAKDSNDPKKRQKHFFQKIKDLAGTVINASNTLRLEVRFGRRVFEVKMKKQDKLETLLQTLPRIIGEDADQMEIYVGRRRLDPDTTLVEQGLMNNNVLRMIHSKRVRSYLKKCDRKLLDDKERKYSTIGTTSSGIEMDSVDNVKEEEIKD